VDAFFSILPQGRGQIGTVGGFGGSLAPNAPTGYHPVRVAGSRPLFFCFGVLVALASSGEVFGQSKKGRVRFHPDWERHPSVRYGAMSAEACTTELQRRGVSFDPVKNAPGVLAPVRLPKGTGGVLYRTEAPEHERSSNPFEVFDCRLALALADFSKVLAAHDIDEVVMFSAWRPPSKAWPAGNVATRHPGALALDVARFGKRLEQGQTQKRWLEVKRDFHGTLGAPVCGAGAAPPARATSEARELRSIVCEAVDQHLFSTVLTPNYNRAHHNHLHMEVTPNVKWLLVR
jgi:hypothetical protein